MTDRELLELAAKAAGYEVDWYPSTRCDLVTKRSAGNVVKLDWSPLTDDGDALRLAVKLNLEVGIWNQDYCHDYPRIIICDNTTYDEKVTTERIEEDPYAATRRAIVRAAAEIGKEIK